MFLRIEKGGIVFTDDGCVPIDPMWDFPREQLAWTQPHSALSWSAPERIWDLFYARILRNENMYFDQLDASHHIETSALASMFYDNVSIAQVRNAGWLRMRYGVSPDEFMGIAAHGPRPFVPLPTDERMSHLLYLDRNICQDPSMFSFGLNWYTKSCALSFIIKDSFSSMYPCLQLLGYGYDAARHMDSTIADWVELPNSAGAIDAQQTVRSFVDHVNFAARCALDTPQPVTLGYGPSSSLTATFENRRLSPSVRGLHITLMTGGAVFLRGAELVPGSDAILHKGRAVPSRKIASAMIEQTALDLVAARIWNDRCAHIARALNLGEPAGFAEFHAWIKSACRQPAHRPRYAPLAPLVSASPPTNVLFN